MPTTRPPRRPSGLRPGDDEIELNAEDIDNFEVGLKSSLLDGRLSFEGAWFDMKREVDQGNTVELDPYTLLDAAVSWSSRGRTRVTLSAHNLLDEEYYWNGDTSRAESADPGAPRQVLLTTSFSFR